jgi:hypothetical protein
VFARRFSPDGAHAAMCEGSDDVLPDPHDGWIDAWLSLATGALSPATTIGHPLARDQLPSGPLTWVDLFH